MEKPFIGLQSPLAQQGHPWIRHGRKDVSLLDTLGKCIVGCPVDTLSPPDKLFPRRRSSSVG